jgi:hypothetical protein
VSALLSHYNCTVLNKAWHRGKGLLETVLRAKPKNPKQGMNALAASDQVPKSELQERQLWVGQPGALIGHLEFALWANLPRSESWGKGGKWDFDKVGIPELNRDGEE